MCSPEILSVNIKQPKISAAILAGGKSKRMGQNKALVEFDGKKMIEYVLESLQACTQEIMIISNSPEKFRFLKRPLYEDIVESVGPLAGIYTALTKSRQEYCLVVACDLPFLSSQLIKFLCEKCTPYDIFAFESEIGVEPLCAVYRKSCLPVIETQIKKRQFKVSDIFGKLRTQIMRLEPGLTPYGKDPFFNVNTPSELARAARLMKSSKR